VLEKGPGWSIKEKCTGRGNGDGGCESLLLVEEEDIYVTSRSYYDGDIDYYYTFRCPVCGKETDLLEKDLPSSIKRELLDRKRKKLTRGGGYFA
jgi:hypothetical protein